MKKSLILAVAAILFAGVAQAKIDLVSAAQQAQNKIDSVAQANEEAKANLEAKKKALADKQAAKKKELEEKQAAQKAEREAKAAEQKKALEDTKNSLNNLKNSFTDSHSKNSIFFSAILSTKRSISFLDFTFFPLLIILSLSLSDILEKLSIACSFNAIEKGLYVLVFKRI